MLEPERVQRASEAYRTLCELDPGVESREELLAAGVAEHTVLALYPTDAESIVQAMIPLLTEENSSHLPEIAEQLDAHNSGLSNALTNLPPDLVRVLIAEHPFRGAGFTKLYGHILQQVSPHVQAESIANRASNLLLGAWWFQQHRAELSRHLQVNADLRMNWVAKHLIPSLLQKVAESIDA